MTDPNEAAHPADTTGTAHPVEAAVADNGGPDGPPAAAPAPPADTGRGGLLGALRTPAIGVSAALLLLLALASLVVPPLLPHGPDELASATALAPPSWAHPLGTDELGRDLLARVLAGTRLTLLVIVTGVPLSLAAGGLLGLFSSAGRWSDTPVQRLFDVVLAFPALILGLAFAAVLGAGLPAVVTTVAVAATPMIGRVLRGAVRAQAHREYVHSARVLGVPTARLYLRHILPNCFDVLLVQTALSCATAVFIEGGMGFLGLGVAPPDPSLGSLLNTSLSLLTSSPFYAIGPLVVISLMVLCFTLLADALNRKLAAR
ncbi:ABC transporter permease [Streptomyces sp. NPDC050560]|uniref:ABC transporter permease n=1 Tax=Streptomyces sp. NPDC050560 TaxID=3365630 RepID=UPI0037B4249C